MADSAPGAIDLADVGGRSAPVRAPGLLGAAAMAAVMVPGVLVLSSNPRMFWQVLLVCVYGAIVFAYLRRWRRWAPWPYASPVAVISIVWFVEYGLIGLLKRSNPATMIPILFGREHYFDLATALLVGSNVLILAGYILLMRRRAKDAGGLPDELPGQLSVVAIWAIWLVSLAARVSLHSTGLFGYLRDQSIEATGFQQPLGYAAELAQIAVAVLALELSLGDRRLGIKLSLGVFLAVESAFIVASGFKGQVIALLAPTLLVFWGLHKRIPVRWVAIAVLGVIAIFPGNLKYRESVIEGRVEGSSFIDTIGHSVDQTVSAWEEDPGDRLVGVWKGASEEVADFIENIALIIYKTPDQLPYLGARKYVMTVPELLLPRFLWEDKPVDMMPRYVSVAYREGPATTAAPSGFVGDLYMHAGPVAVLVGSLVLGMMLALFVKFFTRFRSKRAAVVYAGAIASVIWNPELASLARGLVQRTVVFGLASLLIYRAVDRPLRSRRRQGGGAETVDARGASRPP